MPVVTAEETYISDNSTSYTVVLPSTQQDDVSFVALFCFQAATVSTVAGNNGGTWTLRVDASAGNQDAYVYSCSQSATPDTEVTFTFSAAEYVVFNALNVRYADTTTPVNTSAINFANASYDVPIPAITTTNNNCLIWRVAGANTYPIFPETGMMYRGNGETNGRRTLLVSTTTYQETAGAVPAQTWIQAAANTSNYQGNRITIAINDSGSGVIEGYLDRSVDAYKYLLPMSRYHGPLSFGGTYDPTDVANENITSLSNGSYTNSNIHYRSNTDYDLGPLEPGWRTYKSLVTNTYADYSILHTIPITETSGIADNYDLSDELLCVSNKASDPRTHPDSDIGACIAISDKTNARFWQLGTTNSVPSLNRGVFPSVIDVGITDFVMDDIGTPDMTNCASIIVGSQPTAYYVNTYFSPIWILGEMVMRGGSSTVPASFDTFRLAASKNMLNTVLAQGGLATGQFFICQNTKVGGSNEVYWDCSNQSVEWPSQYDADAKKRNFKIREGRLTHTIEPSASSTAIYNSTTLNLGNYHNLIFNCSTTISSQGLNVLNANVTITAYPGNLAGVSFVACKEITHNSNSFSGGCNFTSCTESQYLTFSGATQSALQTLIDNVANCTFSDNATALRIEYTGTGDITLNFNSITWTNNTADIHYNATSASALTANMQNGSNASTTAFSGSATGVTIANDFTATININVSGAELTILTSGTQTELFHVETATTTEAYTYTYSSDFNGDIQIYKPGYRPYWLDSNLFTNANQTITVNLEEEPASQI